MPLTGGQHTGTGSAVALSTLLPGKAFTKMSIVANSQNTADAYIGPAGMDTSGTNAWIALKPGQGWGEQFSDEDMKDRWDMDSLYVIATASDKVHFAMVY